MASPKQRAVVLKALESIGRKTSEEIRLKAARYNLHLTRISTKSILKELVDRGLVETEMMDRKRYYWISENGKKINRLIGT